MRFDPSISRLAMISALVVLSLSACSGGREAIEYTNVWDQAFAQSMQGTKKKDSGI